ncbi:MAG: ATP-binding protein [Bdellovibrionota bacterium]
MGRLLVFLIPLILTFVNYLLETRFTNWEFLAPNLMVLCAAFAMQTIYIFADRILEKKPGLLFATFVIDSILLSGLILWTGVDQSFYLFLYLVLVLVCGLWLRTWFALILALIVSIEFTTLSMVYKNLAGIQFIFFVVINDMSLFIVAFLSGYLAEGLKETTVSLADLRKLNSFIIDSSPLGLLTLDSKGNVLQVNPVLESLLGGMQPETFLNQLQGETGIENLVEGSDLNFEKTVMLGGVEKIFRVIASRRWSEQLQDGLVLLILEDQTQLKRLEWDLRQKEKLAAVGQLAAGIAHEIRNPLASMSGSIELLSQQTNNDDDKKLMKIVLKEIDRLNNLITEFLDYSRPAQKPTQLVSVTQILSESVDSLKFHPSFSAEIKMDVNVEPDLKMLGFPDKLKQAFLNIIINSLQALEGRPVKSLEIKGHKAEGYIILTIKDSGIGMSEETRKRMFEPFLTTKPKGTGLGLAITYKIFEAHGGKVFVESVPGQFTRFEIKFPC